MDENLSFFIHYHTFVYIGRADSVGNRSRSRGSKPQGEVLLTLGVFSGKKLIQLVEELLIRRFPEFDREEVRTMFDLADLHKTRVWQEAREKGIAEGFEKGVEKGRSQYQAKMVHRCLEKGMSIKEIAELLQIPIQTVRRLRKKPSA